MEIRAREAEKLLADKYAIAPESLIAFRGRLEHLRRLGCPIGIKMGRGKPAMFGWEALVQLSIALDLLDVGVSPEHAANVIKGSRGEIRQAMQLLTDTVDDQALILEAIRENKWPAGSTSFLVVSANALQGLQKKEDDPHPTALPSSLAELSKELAEATPYDSARVTVDLGNLLARLIGDLAISQKRDSGELVTDFIKWNLGWSVLDGINS